MQYHSFKQRHDLKECKTDEEVGEICGTFGISLAYFTDCSPPDLTGMYVAY